MDTSEILTIIGVAVGSPTAALLGRKAWILMRTPHSEMAAVRKELSDERTARLKSSQECDVRLAKAIAEADTRLDNAMARQDARYLALEQRFDKLADKRVADQEVVIERLGTVADRSADAIEANTEVLTRVLAKLGVTA